MKDIVQVPDTLPPLGPREVTAGLTVAVDVKETVQLLVVLLPVRFLHDTVPPPLPLAV